MILYSLFVINISHVVGSRSDNNEQLYHKYMKKYFILNLNLVSRDFLIIYTSRVCN